MSKTIEMDGYIYTLPIGRDFTGADLIDANGEYLGVSSGPRTLVTIAAALNDYRPWRYPSRGELPDSERPVEGSVINETSTFDVCWDGETWTDWEMGFFLNVYAWRELPEPAPVIETEDGR